MTNFLALTIAIFFIGNIYGQEVISIPQGATVTINPSTTSTIVRCDGVSSERSVVIYTCKYSPYDGFELFGQGLTKQEAVDDAIDSCTDSFWFPNEEYCKKEATNLRCRISRL